MLGHLYTFLKKYKTNADKVFLETYVWEISKHDFELFDNYSEVEIATVDDNLIDNVKQVYESILNASMEPFTKKKSLEVDEDKNKTL